MYWVDSGSVARAMAECFRLNYDLRGDFGLGKISVDAI